MSDDVPHDAGSHNQKMTPAVQRVIDAADRRRKDREAMPAACNTPTRCREHGCHGACLPDADDVPPLPDPYRKAVYATKKNTPSVKLGYEMGGYEKEPPLFSDEQMRAYAAACRADERRKTLLEAAELAIQSAEEHERSGEDWRLHAAGGLRRHAHELRALADQPNTKEQA